MVKEGEELAKKGDFKEAVEKFTKAQQFDANIDLNPETEKLDNDPKVVAGKLVAEYFVTQGRELFRIGEFKEAIAAFNKALEFNPDLQISALDWNTLCWFGSVYNHAGDAMFACEKAVAKAPEEGIIAPEEGMIIHSRGLARSLTGDYKGAIEDFEVFVKQTDDDEKSEVQSWINDLQNGKNPFTPEVLEELRNQTLEETSVR